MLHRNESICTKQLDYVLKISIVKSEFDCFSINLLVVQNFT